MHATLDQLLQHLRDDPLDPGEIAALLPQVRALVAADERVPEDLRSIVFEDPTEAPSDAAGLLAALGLDDLGDRLAEAIQVELDSSPAEDLAWEPIGRALAEAVTLEAGRVEIVARVLSTVGLPEADLPLRDAVMTAAGAIDVADAVLAALGLAEAQVPVADAVRAAAGPVDVVKPVLARVQSPFVLPVPANDPRPRWWRPALVATAFAAAAAVLLTVSGGPGIADRDHALLPAARAGEVVIEDMALGKGVEVIQLEGADGSVILWVDEEA